MKSNIDIDSGNNGGGEYEVKYGTNKGDVLRSCDECYGFVEGIAKVEKDGKWGFIDKNGKVVVPIMYDFIGNFSMMLLSHSAKDLPK